MPDLALPWLSLLALGALHGVNPAMGWLFAVGRGLQARDRCALWRALGPLALGHALAIGAALLLAGLLGRVLPLGWLRWVVAAALLGVGFEGLVRHRHPSLGGMHVSARELTSWSFLMASAHGAGLMVLPLVLGAAPPPPAAMLQHHHAAPLAGEPATPLLVAAAGGVDAIGVAAPLVHTLGYLAVTGLLAVVVYEKVGVRILRRAWINLNVVWSGAMIAAAAMALLS
ncbi:MAG TPA: hypothetical protein VFS08_12860 [Gemmatimonadaceae bacterium]|nr:hypothetical protein [Gemmatimonadaceae bacterium]